jgi:predicted esterase
MVSVDVCLKLEESVAALVPWSAGYMNAVEWRQLAPNKKDLKVDKVDFTSPQVYQSHGTEDQVIPFQIGSLLKEEIFEKNGFTLNFQSFGSGHSIPNEVIKTFVDLITSHLN